MHNCFYKITTIPLALAGVVLISLQAGCASPPQSWPPAYVAQERQVLDAQLGSARTKQNELTARRRIATRQAEIDELQRQLDELQQEIADLERRISNLEQKNATTTGAQGRHIGPRGGCYTITKSGKKNYGGC